MFSFESDQAAFELNAKHINGPKRGLRPHLMPTRSNTPEEISPSKLSFGSCSDRESFTEDLTPTTRQEHRESVNTSLDVGDSLSQFEIE